MTNVYIRLYERRYFWESHILIILFKKLIFILLTLHCWYFLFLTKILMGPCQNVIYIFDYINMRICVKNIKCWGFYSEVQILIDLPPTVILLMVDVTGLLGRRRLKNIISLLTPTRPTSITTEMFYVNIGQQLTIFHTMNVGNIHIHCSMTDLWFK